MVAARSCRTIGGVLRLVHVRTCDRPARRVGRFYTETADIGAVLDKAPPAVWACGGPQSIPECSIRTNRDPQGGNHARYFIDVSGGVDGVPFSLQITTH